MKGYKSVSLLVLLSILLFIPSSMGSQSISFAAQPHGIGEWDTGPFPPPAFQYARHDGVFVPGPDVEPWANKVYFPGGRTSPSTELPDIWMFDPITGSYTDVGVDVVEDVSNYNSNLILDDGTGRGPAVYVIGGTDKDHGGVNIGTVQRFYPQTGDMEALPVIDDWTGRVGGFRVAAMGTAVVDDVIYVFGGWETSTYPYFSPDTWAFDSKQPSGFRWTDLGVSLSVPRSYLMTAVQGGKVYAIGGVGSYAGGELDPVDTFEVLDTSNLGAGWTLLSPMPVPGGEGRAFGFSADTLNINSPWEGKIYVVAPNDWPGVSSEVLIYDIPTDTWRDDLPELPTARADLAGSFIPICTYDPDDGLPGLWTFGGRINESCEPPLGPTEFYSLPCQDQCMGLTSILIDGPIQLEVNETGYYSSTTFPADASSPISLIWSNGATTSETSYSWDLPGTYTVVITGTNCEASSVITSTLDVLVQDSCIGLTGIEIDGPINLVVGETASYSVTYYPEDATLPVDINWSNGMTGAQASYSWMMPGSYTISASASNCDPTEVSAVFSVEVHQQMWLPMIIRSEIR